MTFIQQPQSPRHPPNRSLGMPCTWPHLTTRYDLPGRRTWSLASRSPFSQPTHRASPLNRSAHHQPNQLPHRQSRWGFSKKQNDTL